MNTYNRIEPVLVYLVHNYQVATAYAIAKRFDDLEYVLSMDGNTGQGMPMTSENVFRTEHEARAHCIKFLKMRLMVEQTRYERAMAATGAPDYITDVECRESVPVAD